MARRYQQFLGSEPGMIVEIVDDSVSPYLVRNEDGFQFRISAEDFRTYYRPEGGSTPGRWSHLVTDSDTGLIDARKMAELMEIIKPFETAFQDFAKARTFVRTAIEMIGDGTSPPREKLLRLLEQCGANCGGISEQALTGLAQVGEDVRLLLLSDTCAVPVTPTGGSGGEKVQGPAQAQPEPSKSVKAPTTEKSAAKRRAGAKNVEIEVDGDLLSLHVDLSKDLGPSKSGKTTIVASSEGNRSVPGRDEKFGLNIYRQLGDKGGKKGRRHSFKNVEMSVDKDILRITVDLSKEFGPSKSGKTIIVASTEGNQLVYGREEKIGLNVYKKGE